MPEPSFSINEPTSPADWAWCARLMASSDPWITLGRDLAACQATLERPGGELFVARFEGKACGFILLAPYGFAGSPYVTAIAVEAERRGGGVGSRLLEFAEARFARRGRLFLLVSSFNQRAQELYRARGYRLVGELKDYAIGGASELILQKDLA